MPRSEQLTVDFPPMSYILEGGQWIPRGGLDDRLTAYEQIQIAGNYYGFTMESTIDLAGFFLDEDTVLVPQMYVVQDPGLYQAKTASDIYTNSQGLLAAVEIISTRKLNMLTVCSDLYNTLTVPGMPLSIYDKQQIVLGESRYMMPNLPTYDPGAGISNSPGFSVLNRSSSFGYAEKIANQKIYCYRIILPYLEGDGDYFLAPSLRLRMEVMVDKVSSTEYIYSLKRNVELDGS